MERSSSAAARSDRGGGGGIQHDYHDYSQVQESHLPLVGLRVPPPPDSGSAFPIRLHYVLSELERDGDTGIITFQSHGRCFVVRDKDRLLRQILPKWFRQTKLSSFRRQLCLYGFKRITASGPDKGGYYHECFLKGKPFLAHFIKCQKVNGRGKRASASPRNEPDFYRMRHCGRDHSIMDCPTLPPLSMEEQPGDKHSSSTEVVFLPRPVTTATPKKWRESACIIKGMQSDECLQTRNENAGQEGRLSIVALQQAAPPSSTSRTDAFLRHLTSALYVQIRKEEALIAAKTRNGSPSCLSHAGFINGGR